MKQIDEILDFAIKKEEEASDFYLDMAQKAEHAEMKKVFENFAKEEQGHKKKLEAIQRGEHIFYETKEIMDLKISSYVVDIEPSPDMDYQSILIMAMKKEKAAFRFYTDLARSTDNVELSKIFYSLAQEEAKHKLRFEIEYDDVYMKEN